MPWATLAYTKSPYNTVTIAPYLYGGLCLCACGCVVCACAGRRGAGGRGQRGAAHSQHSTYTRCQPRFTNSYHTIGLALLNRALGFIMPFEQLQYN